MADTKTDWVSVAKQLGKIIAIPGGRINRLQFFASVLIFLVLGFGVFGLNDPENRGLISSLLTFYMSYNIYAKRLHDTGETARKIVIMIAVTLVGFGIIVPWALSQQLVGMFGADGDYVSTYATIMWVTTLGIWGMWLFMTYQIGIKLGEEVANRWGEPPFTGLIVQPVGKDMNASDGAPAETGAEGSADMTAQPEETPTGAVPSDDPR